jgi:hypothetical protein
VQRVYVRTDDFRLAHHLLDELESLGISSGLLGVDEPLPEPDAWWFGTPDEVHRLGGRGVPVDVDEVKATVSKWSLTRRRESPPSTLTVGFDSGPRPGCAFLIDGQPMGTKETHSILEAVEWLLHLVQALEPNAVLVRIGHGSPTHRDQLINHVLSLGFNVEMVNEHRTSGGTSRHAHGASALKIALQAGTSIHEQRTLKPTPGELRNLQRISRLRSKGKLTISMDVARLVSHGELSMDEALQSSGYEDS